MVSGYELVGGDALGPRQSIITSTLNVSPDAPALTRFLVKFLALAFTRAAR